MDWNAIKPDLETGCTNWPHGKNGNGYGKIRHNGRSEYAHRAAWLMSGRKIPEGMVLDHICRNRLCVNPDHLELVTNAENIRRGLAGHHMKNGRAPRGDASHVSKVDESAVLRIRSMHKAGKTQRSLAAEFGISQATVSQIVRRVTWGHVQ